MRVLATCDTTGSGWYRVRQIAEALADELDVDITIADKGLPVRLDHGRFQRVERQCETSAGTIDCLDVDVIVLQRPMAWFMPDLLAWFQARGVAVVVETDDDFHAVHPENRAFDFANPRTSPHSNWKYLMACVRIADLVTVSTDALADRYGQHGRVAVLRNCVNDDWLELPHRDHGHVIGWGGTLRNHPTDLAVTRGAVGEIVQETGWEFMCVGGDDSTKDGLIRQLGLREEPIVTPWTPLDGLYPALVSRLDVGIAPLDDIAFNRGKSWLKPLEMSALGLPFVASDLPEYRQLVEFGIRAELVAPKRKHWLRALRPLLADSELRAEVSAHNREVARELTISRRCHEWPEAWAMAIENRRAMEMKAA